jgi:3-hydroxyisobutyrate dehydrogenase-like beta-hydroxyacid dehydrogenase
MPLVEEMPTGALLVDLSTCGPKATRTLASRRPAARRDIEWVDVPVSGGVRRAETRDLL